MFIKIAAAAAVVILGFLAYVSSKPGHFRYERSGIINAAPEVIFPYISDFHKGGEWSPYEKDDPEMKKSYDGTPGQVGSSMTFDSKVGGSGILEIIKIEPNKSVELMLHMTKPFAAENHITYTLTPEASGGTRFSWAMDGDGGFLGKLMTVIIDCEKMVAGKFSDGINNLKTVVESKH